MQSINPNNFSAIKKKKKRFFLLVMELNYI